MSGSLKKNKQTKSEQIFSSRVKDVLDATRQHQGMNVPRLCSLNPRRKGEETVSSAAWIDGCVQDANFHGKNSVGGPREEGESLAVDVTRQRDGSESF